MALNLLDSLNSTAATPEKNPFSLKKKGEPEEGSTEFAQLLGGIMNPEAIQNWRSAPNGAELTGLQAGTDGQKMATDLALAQGQLATTVPATPSLTALVLSPNMTAITPSQAAPDAGSLVAFAKSQGLDEDVAAWLVAAGQGTETAPSASLSTPSASVPTTSASLTPLTAGLAAPEAAAVDAPAPDSPALAMAAAIGLLASPLQGAAKPTAASAASETQSPSITLMPMAPPAAWLTVRSTAAGKASGTAPTPPQPEGSKDTAHTSELDLSLIFSASKEPLKASKALEVPFTPAAWVMAGITSPAAQTATLLSAAALGQALGDDKAVDDSSARVEGLNSFSAERAPAKANETLGLAASSAKGAESSLSTAERNELHQAQAEKMGQAIGQRMLSEMEKGHWHLKMMLRPANLGNIEVEMRLRNGELDANFTAAQAITRDLLQDGMHKLKDTLTQMGMDVANMNVGGGSGQKNGGDPTPQRAPSSAVAAQPDHQEEQAMKTIQQVTSSGQDGLDVLV